MLLSDIKVDVKMKDLRADPLELWSIFVISQIAAPLIDFLSTFIKADFAFLVCLLFGIVGVILIIIAGFRHTRSISGVRFIITIALTLVITIIVWLLIALLFVNLQYGRYDPIVGAMIVVFWVPTLALWSTGWFALLHLGPFAPQFVRCE